MGNNDKGKTDCLSRLITAIPKAIFKSIYRCATPGEVFINGVFFTMQSWFSSGGPGVGSGHERLPPASGNFPSLGPSPPRRNPSPSHRETPKPPVPLRPRKPGPGPPLPITPPMRRKPEPIPRKFLKEPKVPVENVGIQGALLRHKVSILRLHLFFAGDMREKKRCNKRSTNGLS